MHTQTQKNYAAESGVFAVRNWAVQDSYSYSKGKRRWKILFIKVPGEENRM